MRLSVPRAGRALPALAGAVGALWLAAAPAQAVATFAACSAEVAGKVSSTVACQTIDGASNDDATVLNTPPGMFGLTSWEFLARDNVEPEVGDLETLLADEPDDPLSGSFAIPEAYWATYESLGLVFKSGTSSSPACLVGYLLEEGALSGIYNSPFSCPEDQLLVKEISHLSLYGSLESASGFVDQQVPLPAAGALLIAALGGLAAARRARG